MRLVFPIDENEGYLSKRGAHFGKAKFYTVVTVKDNKIVDVESIQNEGHNSGACINTVTNIMSLKPDALIVSGIGGRPAQGFAESGLDVYFDQTSQTVKESIDRFLANELKKSSGQGTCSHN